MAPAHLKRKCRGHKLIRADGVTVIKAPLKLHWIQEQLRDWASKLAQREIERRPEGLKLKQLKELKQKAIDVVMESGTPDTLAISLDKVSQKIGLR